MMKYILLPVLIFVLISTSAYSRVKKYTTNIGEIFECKIMGSDDYRGVEKFILHYDTDENKYRLDVQLDTTTMEWFSGFTGLMDKVPVPKNQFNNQKFRKVFGKVDAHDSRGMHEKEILAGRTQALWDLMREIDKWDPNINDCRPKGEEDRVKLGYDRDRVEGKDIESSESGSSSSGSRVNRD